MTINTNGDLLSLDTTLSVGVYEIEHLENMISVYPNPAKDNLTIRSGNLKMNELAIYDSVGVLVDHQKINSSEIALKVANLPQGIYLIRCSADKGIINNRILIAPKN